MAPRKKTESDEYVVEVVEDIVTSETVESVPAQKHPVSFYLLRSKKYRNIIRGLNGSTTVEGKNSVVTIFPEDPEYDIKVEFMRKSKANRKNGGTSFVEVDPLERRGNDCMLDSLMTMEKGTLLGILSQIEDTDRAMTRGNLMMKILKEKGAI